MYVVRISSITSADTLFSVCATDFSVKETNAVNISKVTAVKRSCTEGVFPVHVHRYKSDIGIAFRLLYFPIVSVVGCVIGPACSYEKTSLLLVCSRAFEVCPVDELGHN